MRISLPYGNEKIEFDVLDSRIIKIISPTDIGAVSDPSQEVWGAIESPINSSSLVDAVHKGDKVSIVCDDITRATPTETLIPPVLSALKSAGVKKDSIQLIIALGTHRKMTDSEMKEKYGEEILEEYKVVNHMYDDHNELSEKGEIRKGLPIWINKRYLESTFRITVGNIIPHMNAGWSGGAKSLLPGLAGEETVGLMHIESARTVPNALGMAENPTRKIIDAYAEGVGLNMIINTVLNREREIVKVFAGHYVNAHRTGIAESKRIYEVNVPELADIVISSSHPADIEFWQGEKGLFSADLAVKDNGGIILVTPCPEGVSVKHPKWIDILAHEPAEIEEMIQRDEVGDLVAAGLGLSLAKIREPHKICIVSAGISRRDAEKMHFEKFSTVEEALSHLTQVYGKDSKISIMTHGGDIYPTIA